MEQDQLQCQLLAFNYNYKQSFKRKLMKSDEIYRVQIEQKSKQAQELLAKIKSRHRKQKMEMVRSVPIEIKTDRHLIEQWFVQTFNVEYTTDEDMIKVISQSLQSFTSQNNELVQKIDQLELESLQQKKKVTHAELNRNDRVRQLNQQLEASNDKCLEMWKKNKDLQTQLEITKEQYEEDKAAALRLAFIQFQTQKTQLQTRAKTFQLEILELKNLLKASQWREQSRTQKLLQDQHSYQIIIKDLQKQIHNLKTVNIDRQLSLEKEIAKRNQKQTEMLAQLIVKANTIADMQYQLSALKDQLQCIELQKQAIDLKSSGVEKEHVKLLNENQTLKYELKDLNKTMQLLKASREYIGKQLQDYQCKNSRLVQELKQTKQNLTAMQESLLQNSDMVDRLNTQVRVDREQIQILAHRKQQLVKNYQLQTRNIQKTWEQQYHHQQKQLQTLKIRYSDIQEERNEWKTKYVELSNASQQQSGKLKELYVSLKYKMDEILEKQARICSLETDIEKLKHQIIQNNQMALATTSNDNQFSQVTTKICQTTFQGKVVLTQQYRTEQRIDTISDTSNAFHQQIAQKNREIQQAKQIIQQLNHKLFESQTRCEQLHHKIKALQGHLRPIAEDNIAMKQTIARLQQQIKQLTAQNLNDNNFSQIKRIKSQKHIQTIQQLTTQLSQAYKKINVLTHQLQKDSKEERSTYKSHRTMEASQNQQPKNPQRTESSRTKSINNFASYFGFSQGST